jgi:endonuclease YncB( thermonuclease family)
LELGREAIGYEINPEFVRFGEQKLYKVVEIISEKELLLDTGLVVRLLGLEVPESKAKEAMDYLNKYVKGKQVFLKFETEKDFYHNNSVDAYVYLKNKIFINKKMLEMGLAKVDTEKDFFYKNKFMEV